MEGHGFFENVIILQKNLIGVLCFYSWTPVANDDEEVAEYIENRLGKFIDSDHDQAQFKWGAKVRIRVILNVCQPLTRVLRLYSMGGDEEITVTFTYDRLPNFCYGCGLVGHILRDCERQLEEPERRRIDELPYGPWLRESREVRFGVSSRGHESGGGWFFRCRCDI
ncbi:UNVERIFIED_CONTAM: hypothetical protein Slati_0471500 [Sesamum latifolium]|uniref:CCHC-type domain-containing protein n=1 Tax=Sesamum latifolium TaxID=2727402 RepID=A0AAW2XWF6_9LAMI